MSLSKNKLPYIIAIIILLAGSLIHIYYGYNYLDNSGHKWGSDDAFISYRYAQNFAHGDGLVFNPGERVEGYSNLLYILILSPACFCPNLFVTYIFSLIINIICLILTFLIFTSMINRRYGENAFLFALFVFALTPVFWAATASGLESVMILLIQVSIYRMLLKHLESANNKAILWLITLSCISILARADGFVFPFLISAYLLLCGRRKDAVRLGGAILIFAGLYIFCRYQYYGYPFPNTYYAKVAGPLAMRIKAAVWALGRLAVRDGMILYILVPLVGLAITIKRLQNGINHFSEIISPELFLICGWLAYWIYVGGDVYYERFLLLIFPLGIALFIRLYWSSSIRKFPLFLITAVVASLQLIPIADDLRFRYSTSRYDFLVNLGQFLGERYPGKVLATSAAGKLPYFSKLKTIDMYGLADTVIAHEPIDKFTLPGHDKEDMDYVLSRNPDIIATFIATNFSVFNGYRLRFYNEKGYVAKYLVNTSKYSRKPDILDVGVTPSDSLPSLIDKEYDFVILEKTG